MRNRVWIYFIIVLVGFTSFQYSLTLKSQQVKRRYQSQQPDLIIILGNIPSLSCVNRVTKILIRVTNKGNAIAKPSLIGIRIGRGNVKILKLGELNPGAFHNVDFNIVLPVPGRNVLTAWADWGNNVNESDENNNMNFINAQAKHCCRDLIISEITREPIFPSSGQSFTITVKVANAGRLRSRPSTGVLIIGKSPELKLFSVPALDSYEEYLYKKSVNFNQPGIYRITARADFRNRVRECKEKNNSKTIPVTVVDPSKLASKKPDLIVTQARCIMTNPRTTWNIKFIFTVMNWSYAPAEASSLRVRILGTDTTGVASTSKVSIPLISTDILSIPVLKPRKSHTVYLYKKILNPGNYLITAHADYNKQVRERDERNNRHHSNFKVRK